MSVADILAKCGMTADDVRKAASKHLVKVNERKVSVARQNERKYADVELEEERWEKNHTGVYNEIYSGTDNGGCTTRKGTYRRMMTGDGRCATQGDVQYRRMLDSKMRGDNGRFTKIKW